MDDNIQIIAKCGSGGQPHPHARQFKNPFRIGRREKEGKGDHSFNLVVCGRIEMIQKARNFDLVFFFKFQYA